MMSFGNDVVVDQSRPRGIRRYPFISEKVTKIERCTSVSVQLSEGLRWAFHHGEGCCQGMAMCPSPSKWITINLALLCLLSVKMFPRVSRMWSEAQPQRWVLAALVPSVQWQRNPLEWWVQSWLSHLVVRTLVLKAGSQISDMTAW